MAHGPGPIDTIRQVRNMTGGSTTLSPAQVAAISRKNVPPPAEQQPQLRYGLPSARPMPNTRSAAAAHAAAINARTRAQSFDSRNPTGPSRTSGGAGAFSTPNSLAGIMALITGLLGRAGTSQLLGTSLADAAAAPDMALAQQLQSEIDGLPDAKAQALANIKNWYGQVQTSEKNAATNDQTSANNLADALKANAQGIASGLGGSAMAGSAQIGAMGANDSNAMKAIGASDAQLASDLAPIFDLQKAGMLASTGSKFDQGKIDLQNQLAAATGQESADKANALMSIVGANNKSRQDNFANSAGLLNTLAGLDISGMNAQSKAQSNALLNALRASEIQKNQQKTVGGFDAAPSSQRAKVAQAITAALVDPNSHKLMNGMDWPTALRTARNVVRTNGWNPLDPTVVSQIIQPALNLAGVNFADPQAFYQP